MFGSKSKSTRVARTTATDGPTTATDGPTTAAVPPPPARSRWLKGHHSRNEAKHVGELKTTLHDPNTTSVERDQAKTELKAMGRGKEAHVPMSVKVKSMFRSNKGAHATTAGTTRV